MAIPFAGFAPPSYSLPRRAAPLQQDFSWISDIADNALGGFTAGKGIHDEREAGDLLARVPETFGNGVGSIGAVANGSPSQAVSHGRSQPYSLTPDDKSAVAMGAQQLGMDPSNLAALMSYESGINPNRWGGKGGQYLGAIQFSPENQRKYGIHPGMSLAEQMPAVVKYFQDRGYKPGMGLPEAYSIVNAGSLDRNGQPRWGASDGNGNIRTHVEAIQREHLPRVQGMFSTAHPSVPAPGMPGTDDLVQRQYPGDPRPNPANFNDARPGTSAPANSPMRTPQPMRGGAPGNIAISGDSIAVGIGQQMRGARVNAQVGIPSAAVVQRIDPNAAVQVVSLGANDDPAQVSRTVGNAVAARQRNPNARFVWVVPANNPKAAQAITAFARSKGDPVITFQPGRDGIHPANYGQLAQQVQQAAQGGAQPAGQAGGSFASPAAGGGQQPMGAAAVEDASPQVVSLDNIEDVPPKLQAGGRGKYVQMVQAALLQRGFKVGDEGRDGNYGPATRQAIAAFQQRSRLPVTGEADRPTVNALGLSDDALLPADPIGFNGSPEANPGFGGQVIPAEAQMQPEAAPQQFQDPTLISDIASMVPPGNVQPAKAPEVMGLGAALIRQHLIAPSAASQGREPAPAPGNVSPEAAAGIQQMLTPQAPAAPPEDVPQVSIPMDPAQQRVGGIVGGQQYAQADTGVATDAAPGSIADIAAGPPVPRPNPMRAPPAAAAPPTGPADAATTQSAPEAAPVAPVTPIGPASRVQGGYSPQQVQLLQALLKNPLTREFGISMLKEKLDPQKFEFHEVNGQWIAFNPRDGTALAVGGTPEAQEQWVPMTPEQRAQYGIPPTDARPWLVNTKTGEPKLPTGLGDQSDKVTPYSDPAKLKHDLDAGLITQEQYDQGLTSGGTRENKPSDTSTLAKEFENQPGVSRFRQAYPVWQSMASSVDDTSSMSDFDFVYGMAQIYDPTSVVRESEGRMVAQGQSLPDWFQGVIDKSINAGQTLSRETRLKLVQSTRRRVEQYRSQAEGEAKFYTDRAQRNGFNPLDVVRPLEALPTDAGAAQGGAPQVPQIHSDAEYEALQSGTEFIDPEGNRRRKP